MALALVQGEAADVVVAGLENGRIGEDPAEVTTGRQCASKNCAAKHTYTHAHISDQDRRLGRHETSVLTWFGKLRPSRIELFPGAINDLNELAESFSKIFKSTDGAKERGGAKVFVERGGKGKNDDRARCNKVSLLAFISCMMS